MKELDEIIELSMGHHESFSNMATIHQLALSLKERMKYSVVVEIPEPDEDEDCSSNCIFARDDGGCKEGWSITKSKFLPTYDFEIDLDYPGPNCPRGRREG